MSAKVSSRRVRFFAHIRRSSECTVGVESYEHIRLKGARQLTGAGGVSVAVPSWSARTA